MPWRSQGIGLFFGWVWRSQGVRGVGGWRIVGAGVGAVGEPHPQNAPAGIGYAKGIGAWKGPCLLGGVRPHALCHEPHCPQDLSLRRTLTMP